MVNDMANRDDFITIIRAFRDASPTISNQQRKGLIRQAVQNYGLTVDEAAEIISLNLVVGEEINYFEMLGLSVSEFGNRSETDIVHRVETAHKKLYAESLQAGGRPRTDGKTEEQWRTLLNQARDVLIDTERRQLYVASLQDNDTTPLEIVPIEEEPTPEQALAIPTEKDGMVLIPAGDFQMGSDEHDAPEDEKPAHAVYVDAFYIDKYPVTNAQYKEFVNANPEWRNLRVYNFQLAMRIYRDSDYLKNWFKGKYPGGKDDHPVTWVSWHAAMAYAKWVGKRLPTEAEWEKAARGGLAGQIFPWGNAIYTENANFDKRIGETTPVGKYPANRYGVCDIIGNVSECCLDKWDSKFYKSSERNNPISGSIESIVEAPSKSKKYRVIRGGSWNSSRYEVRVSNRACLAPWKTNSFVGFRCVAPIQS